LETAASPANVKELIEVPFRLWICGDSKNHILGRGQAVFHSKGHMPGGQYAQTDSQKCKATLGNATSRLLPLCDHLFVIL